MLGRPLDTRALYRRFDSTSVRRRRRLAVLVKTQLINTWHVPEGETVDSQVKRAESDRLKESMRRMSHQLDHVSTVPQTPSSFKCAFHRLAMRKVHFFSIHGNYPLSRRHTPNEVDLVFLPSCIRSSGSAFEGFRISKTKRKVNTTLTSRKHFPTHGLCERDLVGRSCRHVVLGSIAGYGHCYIVL